MNRDNGQAGIPAAGLRNIFNPQARMRWRELGVAVMWNALHAVACTTTVCGLVITGLTNSFSPLSVSMIFMAAIGVEVSGWYLYEEQKRKGNPDYQALYTGRPRPPKP